jgi:hypothetical protein
MLQISIYKVVNITKVSHSSDYLLASYFNKISIANIHF